MAVRKMAINTWRKLNFACDEKGEPLAGALSLPTIRKMIDNDELPGERLGSKYFVYVQNDSGKVIETSPLISRVMAG